jgi:predicted glycoside hydrolase/deacetylase ChbG (UPF0249 family)
MAARGYLIVNADDFGQSPGTNRGIAEAHERGIVTSASLMVRWPAAAAAAAYTRANPKLSVGLHFDLGEWFFRDGAWVPRYEMVPIGDPRAVEEEADRQLDAFVRLMGTPPTHLDSHQHVHLREPARSALERAARKLQVPLRQCDPRVGYRGDFYGQTAEGQPLPGAISVDGLLGIVATLTGGVTELGCHPGLGDDLDTTYLAERGEEVRVLCNPRVRDAIAAAGVELRSFSDLPAGPGKAAP